MDGNVLFAFILTLLAGLATGLGSIIAFFARSNQYRFLAFGLGLSAGVMIYISFLEILPEAEESLVLAWGENLGPWVGLLAFFGGIGITALIDRLVPHAENPHEIRPEEDLEVLRREGDVEELKDFQEEKEKSRLMRTGLFTAGAIAVHNFPEGIATFIAAMVDPALGVSIAIAIAIHNIPEGVSVSVPIYFATGNRKKAFFYSFLSGMAEPAGALIAYFILMPFLTDALMGILFAGIAGIMVYISFDELLPMAREYGEGHTVITGLVIGMAVMGISLLLL